MKLVKRAIQLLLLCTLIPWAGFSESAVAPNSQPGNISGTVTDTGGAVIPGATVSLEGTTPEDRQTAVVNDDGGFQFDRVRPGDSWRVSVSAKGFAVWKSSDVRVNPGQYVLLTDIRLKLELEETSVTVSASPEQIAAEQVRIEEQQRVLGIIPNFFVVYDRNPAPLSAQLKFRLAARVATDPITYLGTATLAGIYQAADYPGYGQGAAGYGKRLGAIYGGGVTDIMFGGAILPSLLHQDPRYYYQGTGTTMSRTRHALASPFICHGDNGTIQPNYSSIGGDLIASAVTNAYYPASDRSTGRVFQNVGINTAERMVGALVQEFVLRKLTPSAKNRD
jgi:hypothetical protein